MIEPYSATTILLAFLLLFGVIIPVVGTIPKIKEIISYRYLIVVCFLACMIGVIINFGDLDTSVRMAVIIGTSTLCGGYIILRSVEKWMANGWQLGKDVKASVSKGDAKVELEVKENGRDNE